MALDRWTVDVDHSSIDFSVRHMMVSKVKGTFQRFSAEIQADPDDLTTASVRFEIAVNSVDTRNQARDKHLVSADFFDAENHPKITFQSTRIVKKSEGEYEVTGDLTIRGVTRPETFLVTYEGQGKDPWGNIKVGFSGHGTINREEYGLKWNAALETGGVLVGNDVQVSIELEASKQA
ncbi:MAG: YceI family protein [Alicyclobacillus shizuokensis]|nr:YceI family protein [Alicyclobacillus shizuokensis]